MNFSLIKLVLCFLAGILLGFYAEFTLNTIFWIGAILFIVFIFSYFRAGKLLFPDALFGISCYLIFIALGIFTDVIHESKNPALEQQTGFYKAGQDAAIMGVVSEKLKSVGETGKYLISLQKIHKQNAEGKLLLNIVGAKNYHFPPGAQILLPLKMVSEINKPLNPYVFDYRKYMLNLRVQKEITCKPSDIKLIKITHSGIQIKAAQLRDKILFKLKSKNFAPNELALMQALLLGQRQDVPSKIYREYSAAGVVHILAVSGLHVGILLLILNWLLIPLERLRKGKLLKTFLLILLLWGFAIIAGLSPSVVRAVTMFSFLAIGMQMNRKTSIVNAAFISMLILLLFNPKFIFQVGFQLSYAAVFAIAFIQPLLGRVFIWKNKFLRYFWELFTVTLAAQIGVLPLSLFYFHQFPGLFFVSNLIILPFLGIILGLGILVILLALFNSLPDFLANFYGNIIFLLNKFVSLVAGQEDFIIKKIYMPLLICIGLYLFIMAIINFLRAKNYRSFMFLLIGIISLQSTFIISKKINSSSEFIVFQKTGSSEIGIKMKEHLFIYQNKIEDSLPGFIDNYALQFHINAIEKKQLHNFLAFQKQSIQIIDSTAVYEIEGAKPDILILTNSPKVNLSRLLAKINPGLIIADGSNYKSYAARWEKTCAHKKTPFYNTAEKGAYRLVETGENPAPFH